MSYIDQNQSEPNILPWIGGALGVSAAMGGAAYSLSQSVGGAVVCAGVIALCLGLGWWASSINAHNVAAMRPQENAPAIAPITEGEELAPKGALSQFANAAIEATPNPVIIIDDAGRIITTNQAARVRFNIGAGPLRIHSVMRRPDIIEAIDAVLLDKQARTLAIETRVPVDRYERVSVAAFEIDNAPYVLVSALDETEARMSERMRADFLANASHELRTPLAAIIGFIETLRGPARDDTKARERFLEVMHVQADRMSRLISDLLSLSRIELNEHVPPTQRSDIAAATYEAVDGLTPDKKARLVIDSPNAPIWVLGDRDEMAQVLLNLIDNALKYSHPGTKIHVSVQGNLSREEAITRSMRQWSDAARLPLTSPEMERDRTYSVVRVENAGEGIERQHLPRLSERFFRIEDTASGKSGTGLGLAIVKHIVSRHRGGLVVESELGRGSAFSVYLPQPFETAHEDQLQSHRATPINVT
jgi:two-component system, OmpR family, phosphate regulon sensor histidine kinase PhoR